MRSGADVDTRPGDLDNKQVTRLHQLLHEAKFKDPDGSHLSPAGCPAAYVKSSTVETTAVCSNLCARDGTWFALCLNVLVRLIAQVEANSEVRVHQLALGTVKLSQAMLVVCCQYFMATVHKERVVETKQHRGYKLGESVTSYYCCTGEYNLRLGIMKELHPDMVATHQGAPLCHPLALSSRG